MAATGVRAGAPTGLTATADGETGIDLSWTAPAADGGDAITGYRIEVSSDGGSAWTDLVADTGSADTTHSHTGLSAGSTRHYRVSAINAVGSGAPSGVAYATTALSDLLVGSTGQSGDPGVIGGNRGPGPDALAGFRDGVQSRRVRPFVGGGVRGGCGPGGR